MERDKKRRHAETKNTTDIDIIKEMEDIYGVTIKQCEKENLWEYNAAYAADSQGNVTALKLTGQNITDISALSGLANLATLYLSGNQLTDISALSGLANLATLYLSNNQLTDISALSGLANLTTLWLNDNQLTDISALSGLANLATLWLNNNQLTDISALSGLANLTTLWLNDNQLTDISALSGLANLTELRLYNNQLTDISALSGLANLTELWLNNNQLTDISALSGLANLSRLDLNNNQLTDISALSGLANLTELHLYNNQLTDISALSGLANLSRLDLDNNQLTDISALSGLANLATLDLRSNQLTDISALSGLANLSRLDLDNNQLTDISALSGLANLTELGLGDNQLTDISALSGLANLSRLDLDNNQLTDISALSGLANLTELRLYNNQLTDISALSGLANLATLWLNNNQLTDISALSELPTLKRVLLADNKITKIPRQWIEAGLDIKWEYDGTDSIFLKGNPLQFPPIEIVQRGPDAVREYYEQTKKKTIPLRETKLLIVGPGDVGKTTLLKKLKNPETQIDVGKEATTHGIDIHPWQLDCQFDDNPHSQIHPPTPEKSNGSVFPEHRRSPNAMHIGGPGGAAPLPAGRPLGEPPEAPCQCTQCKIHIHFWDFGGQEIYHATHQFFLTKRSLYLFVWDARKDDDDPQTFDYWLNIIKLLGKESPVIVVQNKADVRFKSIDEASIQDKFPNIRGFFTVSCKDGRGIGDLTESIRAALGQMDHLHDPMPKSWKTIRDELRQMADSTNYITRDQFVAICADHHIDEPGADVLSDYLHDLGAILHFRDDQLLENTVILKPQWATEAVYKLVDAPGIQEEKGRFHKNDLKKYWDKTTYPSAKHPQLIRLMEEFELCFPIPGSPFYIIPELLPAAATSQIQLAAHSGDFSLRFLYLYDFMPGGIISRFIARNHALVNNQNYWKNGVELSFEDAAALLRGDRHSRKLTVTATGGSCKNELMGIIKYELNHIHRTLNMEPDNHYKEKIPCPCPKCSAENAKNPYRFDYPMLLRRWEKGKTTIDCRASDEEIQLSRLLRGFVPDVPLKNLDFTHELIKAGHYLQGRRKNLVTSEDSWTDFIATILEARGLRVDNQSRWGYSESNKSIGRPDLRISNPEGNTLAIVEAFRLKGRETSVIEPHLKKMFNYDPSGCEINYALVYVETENFAQLWKWYKTYVAKIDFEHPLKEFSEKEKKTGYTNLRVIQALHKRADMETSVYHIFIHMPPAALRGRLCGGHQGAAPPGPPIARHG